MGKKGTLFFAALCALTGGGFFVGNQVYGETVQARKREDLDAVDAKDQAVLDAHPARQDVTTAAIDGVALRAIHIPAERPNGRYVILLHDAHGKAEDTAQYAARYLEKGASVLAPDMRGCGKSGGDYIGYGWDDRLDVLTWTHWILKRDPKARIVLHGLGAGAAAALCALSEHIPTQVFCAISDASFTTAPEYLARQLQFRFPSRLPVWLRLFALRMVTQAKAGYRLSDASPLDAVRRASTPALFIHGDADMTTPQEMCRSLYARAQCARQIGVFLGAGHIKSMETDPARYWSLAEAFIDKYDPARL